MNFFNEKPKFINKYGIRVCLNCKRDSVGYKANGLCHGCYKKWHRGEIDKPIFKTGSWSVLFNECQICLKTDRKCVTSDGHCARCWERINYGVNKRIRLEIEREDITANNVHETIPIIELIQIRIVEEIITERDWCSKCINNLLFNKSIRHQYCDPRRSKQGKFQGTTPKDEYSAIENF